MTKLTNLTLFLDYYKSITDDLIKDKINEMLELISKECWFELCELADSFNENDYRNDGKDAGWEMGYEAGYQEAQEEFKESENKNE